jgi:antagonist of KipI
MSELHVITSGMLTTVQDLGRWGFQSHGVPVAGPMDVYAHRLANALAGNRAGAATLEMTLVGPELELDDDRMVAVTGAMFELTVADDPRPMHTAFAVRRGSRVKFGRRLRGARAYLAVEGGIDVPSVLGSRATHLTTAMGGVEGRALKAGDRVPIGPAHSPPEAGHHARSAEGELPGSRGVRNPSSLELPPSLRLRRTAVALAEAGRRTAVALAEAGPADPQKGPARLRVLPGPHSDYFADEALRVLQTAPYTIDQKSDRMAFRLDGVRIPHASADLISDATPMGTIQVLPSGLPILLMADRQTTGGYPQLATVISADFRIAGQLAPGEAVSFAVCSAADAMMALIAQERALMAVEPRGARR